jgi:hypothetical protein
MLHLWFSDECPFNGGRHLFGPELNELQTNNEDITFCRCGGRCISTEYTDAVGKLAKSYGLQLHIDGARIFNVSIVRAPSGLVF